MTAKRIRIRVFDAACAARVTMPVPDRPSEHAIDSQQLRPELVGHVATMDGLQIEVVDVVATGGTQREPTRWLAATGVPEVHVQVRISRD